MFSGSEAFSLFLIYSGFRSVERIIIRNLVICFSSLDSISHMLQEAHTVAVKLQQLPKGKTGCGDKTVDLWKALVAQVVLNYRGLIKILSGHLVNFIHQSSPWTSSGNSLSYMWDKSVELLGQRYQKMSKYVILFTFFHSSSPQWRKINRLIEYGNCIFKWRLSRRLFFKTHKGWFKTSDLLLTEFFYKYLFLQNRRNWLIIQTHSI